MATIDLLTLVPHLPKPDEVYEVHEIEIQGGGPVASALTALAKLGVPTRYLGVMAPDQWGERIINGLQHDRIDTSHVHYAQEGQSSISCILVEAGTGRRSILYKKGTYPPMTPAQVSPESLRGAHTLHLDGFHLTAALEAAHLARKAGVLVSFDGGAGPRWAEIESLLPLVDILIVARQFAENITSLTDVTAAGDALRAYGAKHVVLTDGPNGAWAWNGTYFHHQPAFQVPVQDTTGAGDAFHGAYLYALLQQWSVETCLAFASATAALNCRQLGGRAGLPTVNDVQAFLKTV